ncbi:MAG TPA: glycolate oxidase subunit GlcE [Gammaproteobacteria bacterium]|nr:glycolate oxidase subunit GlcE [Gammaproteobacteria bacterium]
MRNSDNSDNLQQQVRDSIAEVVPLRICGGNTKLFYGNKSEGKVLDVNSHTGIVSYEPTELVITARAGTPVKEINAVLAEQNQMLAFEPRSFGEKATIGGTIACNFSGPRRPYAGAARDFVLGSKIINGKAEILGFGGQVMKNVAGYDVSRLMAGALGTLGIILDVSLKVLPKSDAELTLVFHSAVEDSLHNIHQWQRLPLPISACCFDDKTLTLRLSGTHETLTQAKHRLGGDELADADTFWGDINEQQTDFFKQVGNLWRVSLASNAPVLDLAGEWFYDWGGAQRWLRTELPANEVRAKVEQVGGHATLIRGDVNTEKFHPLPAGLMKVHRKLKQAFDPYGIFNRGRLYRDI